MVCWRPERGVAPRPDAIPAMGSRGAAGRDGMSPVEMITSHQNAGVKRVVRLRGKGSREAPQLTLVEGVREVRQALRAGWRIDCAYVCREGVYHCPDDLLGEVVARGGRGFATTAAVFSRMAYGDRTDGVIAVVEHPERGLADLHLGARPLLVVLEGVEKPGNLGAILRTCDAAGVDALLVCDGRCDVHNPNVVRASLGAVFTVPIVTCSGSAALHFLRSHRIAVIAAVVGSEVAYFDQDLVGPVGLVLGSEKDGLSPFWQDSADVRVQIPMDGVIDSLNVSVSAAVMVFEAVRQRAGRERGESAGPQATPE
jgi:RNA methyltransferase, TrmH family